jgi:hypothetical protein
VEPGQTKDTAKRLQSQHLPFGASPILVVPDSRAKQIENAQRVVPLVAISTFLGHPKPETL